jgi:hypothetical protein
MKSTATIIAITATRKLDTTTFAMPILRNVVACQSAFNFGTDSLPMSFAGDLGFSDGMTFSDTMTALDNSPHRAGRIARDSYAEIGPG